VTGTSALPDSTAVAEPVGVTTIGFLECDHIDERFRPVGGGDAVDMFRALFAAHAPGVELVPYDVIGGEPLPGPGACAGWLCPGSRHSVYDDLPWIAPLSAFVRDVHAAGVPFFGVCFGHQLVAHALGGRVARSARGWGAGVEQVRVTEHAPWMEPRADGLALHFMHQDQVEELPPGGVVLGSTDHCPVALLQVGSLVGVQAHPEFTPPYTDALLVDRVARIGDDEVAGARASLAQPTGEATVARWIERVMAGVLR
jgi:GMP synthase-like glutamine amidotransferase